ncbi:MAG TPA: Rieske 2Fe-2S domain-containing protein, partial [Methylomirabilota bacterium]|nr:Rieske 2Fe-2S domain-containing protein [Methylomirabilota bacterium]
MSDARLAGLAESAAQGIERQEWMAPLEERLQRAVTGAFAAGGTAGRAVKNFLHGTWLGHPLHPVLTDVPIGAWTTALVFDALDAGSHGWPWQRTVRRGADDAILVGIVGALGAAVAGVTDWQHTDGKARRTGLAHAMLNTIALGLYTGSLLMRRRGARGAGRTLAGAGFGVMLASAYLGGRLIYREHISVDHAQREEPEGYLRALRESELREGQPVRAELNGLRVVVVKRGGRVYALGERCSHLGGPLAEGQLQEESIVCPWHGSRFALEDGRVLDGPATMPQPCFETRV